MSLACNTNTQQQGNIECGMRVFSSLQQQQQQQQIKGNLKDTAAAAAAAAQVGSRN